MSICHGFSHNKRDTGRVSLRSDD